MVHRRGVRYLWLEWVDGHGGLQSLPTLGDESRGREWWKEVVEGNDGREWWKRRDGREGGREVVEGVGEGGGGREWRKGVVQGNG